MTGADKVITRVIPIRAQRFQFAVTVAVPFRELGRWVMWLVQRFQFAVMPLILSMGTAHTAEQIDATIRRDRYLVSSILC